MAEWGGSGFSTFSGSDPITGAVTGGLGAFGGGSAPGTGEWGHADRAMVASAAIKGVASASSGIVNGFFPGAGTILGLGLGSIGDTVSNSAQAYGCQKMVAGLKGLYQTYPQLKQNQGGDWKTLNDIIEYALNKKKSQWGRYGSKAVPGLNILTGAGVSAYQLGKGIYKLAKKTKGVHRAEMANALLEMSKKSDPVKACANQIIVILAGQTFEDMLKKSVADSLKSGV